MWITRDGRESKRSVVSCSLSVVGSVVRWSVERSARPPGSSWIIDAVAAAGGMAMGSFRRGECAGAGVESASSGAAGGCGAGAGGLVGSFCSRLPRRHGDTEGISDFRISDFREDSRVGVSESVARMVLARIMDPFVGGPHLRRCCADRFDCATSRNTACGFRRKKTDLVGWGGRSAQRAGGRRRGCGLCRGSALRDPLRAIGLTNQQWPLFRPAGDRADKSAVAPFSAPWCSLWFTSPPSDDPPERSCQNAPDRTTPSPNPRACPTTLLGRCRITAWRTATFVRNAGQGSLQWAPWYNGAAEVRELAQLPTRQFQQELPNVHSNAKTGS